MSFFDGKISGITRFRIDEDLSQFDELIMKGAFRALFPENSAQNIGFVSINDCLDSELTTEKTLLADYRVFSLRIDRRVIPPSTMKIRLLEKTKEFLAETGQKRLYREQRENIRESIQADLWKKIPPVTDVYDVAIDWSTGIVYLSTLTSSVIDKFADIFKEAFGIYVKPYDVVSREEIEKVSGGTTAPIGRDFLTWLWFRSNLHDGLIEINNWKYTVSFVNRIVFEFDAGEYTETVVCSGVNPEIKEAKEALRQDKKIKEARIRIENEQGDTWTFGFKADSFKFQSVKLPTSADEDEETPEGRNLERLGLMSALTDRMDDLFEMYLQLRLSPDWPEEVAAMHAWAMEE